MCQILVLPDVPKFLELKDPEDTLVKMTSEMEKPRNIDACGFFATDGQRYTVLRLPVPCGHLFRYMRNQGLLSQLLEKSKTLMIHARAMTRGDPLTITNNHPFYYEEEGDVIALIHNGSIDFNETKKEEEKAVKEFVDNVLKSETDSPMMLAALVLFSDKSDDLKTRVETALKLRFIGKASVAIATLHELVYFKNIEADISILNIDDDKPIFATSKSVLKVLSKTNDMKTETTTTYTGKKGTLYTPYSSVLFHFIDGEYVDHEVKVIVYPRYYATTRTPGNGRYRASYRIESSEWRVYGGACYEC